MKNNTLKFLVFLSGIILPILTVCPSYPTIPRTSIPYADSLVLTANSPGMISLNPALSKLSMTLTVTLDQACPEGGYWDVFALTVNPEGEPESDIVGFYLECTTFDLYAYGVWGDDAKFASVIFTGDSRTLNIYISIDLEEQRFWAEVNSVDNWKAGSFFESRLLQDLILVPVPGGPSEPKLDESTKLYLCSNSDPSDSALTCTISRLRLLPTFAGDNDFSSYLGDFTPVSQAFYPLISGDLTSVIKSTDSASSSAKWDSSNSFVKITGDAKLLTVPIPAMAQSSIIPSTLTVAFWVRVTSLPYNYPKIFSLILDDGNAGFSLEVEKNDLKVTGGEMSMSHFVYLTQDTWQQISCSFFFSPGDGPVSIVVSVGDSKTSLRRSGFGTNVPTKVQFGDKYSSFIGDISSVRILFPGASYLTNTNTCPSSNALVEINSGPYAILCADGFAFNPYDNKCYSSCPAPSETVTPFDGAPFTLCLSPVVEESGGLSGGAIAGIVIGSIAGVAMIAAVGYFAKLKIAKVAAKKAAGQAYQMKSPTTENANTTTNMVSP